MNDIQSHKHGSVFSNPVKEKDAPGYSEIIRRATDLKSIRTAINAGNRAATNILASSPSLDKGENVVELPISEELVPPKGIVNSAQLEKEIMRMFANAIVFNPGDDGVVQDAREMFEDVQTTISNWRNAESGMRTESARKADVDDEDDELAGPADEVDHASGRRRRI